MSLQLKTVCFAWHVHCCQSRLKLSILGAYYNFCLISRQLCGFASFVKMVSLYENGVFWLECANVSKLVENSLYQLLLVTVRQFEENFAFPQDLLTGVQILQN